MRSNAVQFKGIDQVVEAYEMNEMASWSIWNGPNLMFAYEDDAMDEGAKMLKQAIEMLQKGQSEGAYTLKVYKDAPGEIRSNTPYSRAFNFHLFGEGETKSPQAARANNIIGVINDRFQEMQATILGRVLDKIDAEDEEDAKPEKAAGLMGMINGLLENPQIQIAVANKLGAFVTGLLGIPQGPQAIAGINPGTNNQPPVSLSAEQEDKINQAIDILAACDPQLGDNLLKIAAIARDSPGKYSMYVSML